MKKRLLILLCAALALALSLPAQAAQPRIVASTQSLLVDGAEAQCEKYNIDGYNYFKLRDLAALLTDTQARFAVDYDKDRNAVVVTTGLPYTPNGTELTPGPDRSAEGVLSPQSLWIDGVERRDFTVWNIGGHNFFQLRELGKALGFGVDYDAPRRAACVDSGGPVGAVGAGYLALRQWVSRSYNAFDAATGAPVYWRKAPFGSGVWRRCGVSCGDGGALRLHFQGFTDVLGEIYATLALTPGGTVHRATFQYYTGQSVSAVPFYGEADIDAAAFSADALPVFDVVRGWPEDTSERGRMSRLLRDGLVETLDLAQTLLHEEAAPGLGLGISDFGFDENILPEKDASPFVTCSLARPLRLWSHDGTVFLGVAAHYDREGVWNSASSYADPGLPEGVRNPEGRYGSETSDFSPYNPYAAHPPVLRDASGGFVCYVSANEGYVGAYTMREISLFMLQLGE